MERSKRLVSKMKEALTGAVIRVNDGIKFWVLKNWVRYVAIKNLFLVSGLSIVIALAFVSGFASLAYGVVLLAVIALSFLLDGERVTIIEGDPLAFVTGEKIDQVFHTLSNVAGFVTVTYSYAIIAGSLVYRVYANLPSFTIPQPLLSVFLALLLMMVSIFTPSMISSLESSYLFEQARRNRPSWNIPQYFISERARACARFVVISNLLPSPPSKKALKDFSYFKQGIEIYNERMKERFGVTLCEPERFFKFAKLKAFFTDDVDAIRGSTKALIDLMKNRTEQPLEFIKLLKRMVNEHDSCDNLCSDVDVETNQLRKWFQRHRELFMVFIIPIVSSVIAGIILYTLNFV